MTPDQQAAHDWLLSQPDVITCPIGPGTTIMTRKACRLRQAAMYKESDDPDPLVSMNPMREQCGGCPEYDPVNIRGRKRKGSRWPYRKR